MPRKTVLRPNDYVRIVDPQWFVRCGYPLTPAVSADYLLENHHDDIQEFLVKIGIAKEPRRKPATPDTVLMASEMLRMSLPREAWCRSAYDRFMYGLGFLYTNAKRMGGDTRSIHTEHIDPVELGINGDALILDKRVVMTGDYFPPGGGGEDYEPGGLANQKAHVLVKIFAPKGYKEKYASRRKIGFWIEETRVKRTRTAAEVEATRLPTTDTLMLPGDHLDD